MQSRGGVMRVMRILAVVVAMSALSLASLAPRAWAKQNGEGVEIFVALAMKNNPEIQASAERWQMSVERARQAGALEDPMMMLRIQNALIRDPLNFKLDETTAKVIGLSQKLPFFGKRELMRAEADQEAEAEHWVVEERRLELRRMVKETWYQLSLVDRSLETVSATIRLLDDLLRLAESMYSVGKAGQQEVFQAQLERSKMEEMRIGLEQKRRSLAATLNTLAYRPPDTPIAVIKPITLQPMSLSAADLERVAQDQRPALKTLAARIKKADTGTQLAEKEIFPDVTVFAEYMQRDEVMDGMGGDDMYSAGLSFNLPVQSERRRGKVAEMEASRRMAVQELAVLRNQIRLAISDGLAQLERSRKTARLYDTGMLVQAKGAVESTIAAYRAGTAKLSEALATRMNLFTFERDYHGAVAEHQMQWAVLEGVVGVELPPKP